MKTQNPKPLKPKVLNEFESHFLEEMYRKMYLIRHFELSVNDQFLRGVIPGTIHLSHGQEAVEVGTCLALQENDFITLTHRGHGQALAKGVSPKTLMAELFGKATGCCHGKGGSLHVGDFSVGALSAISIVGASSPIAAGMAFAFKRHQSGQIVCNFFGDGATNKGDWHEALNLAAIWSLPVIFLCENNLYAVSTRLSDVMRLKYVSQRAAAYGMPGTTIFGNDPILVFEAVSRAADDVRQGNGPVLIECLTYRQGGHKRDDPATYRPQDEVKAWLETDPLLNFRERLLQDERFEESKILEIENEVNKNLQEAIEFATNSPEPQPEIALEDVYA